MLPCAKSLAKQKVFEQLVERGLSRRAAKDFVSLAEGVEACRRYLKKTPKGRGWQRVREDRLYWADRHGREARGILKEHGIKWKRATWPLVIMPEEG